MKPMRIPFAAVLLALGLVQAALGQSIALFPDEVPNGIEAISGDQYHQRFDITLTGSPAAQSRAFTVTVPPELTAVANSVTATSDNANIIAFYAGAPATNQLAFGITLVAGTLAGQVVTVELDLTTPTDFTGIANGSKLDTSYVFDFSTGSNLTDTDVAVAKHQNRPVRVMNFSAPDSTAGDTTRSGGRYFKLAFPSALPDPSHTGISGISAAAGFSDGTSDVLYSFYLSQDSTLIRRTSEDPVAFWSLMSDGSGGGPLLGTRQQPRRIPATFVRESYVSTFSGASLDSLNGLASLSGTVDNGVYYVYVLADPAPGRFPAANLANGGSAKKGYDPTQLGVFSGGIFLGRSGPLLVQHPPWFVVVGWDFDNDGGDDFDNTGVIQVPGDIINMAAVDANRKDNRSLTVDTGSFLPKGLAFASLNSGQTPDPVSTASLLFLAQDGDDPQNFSMNIFLSTQSGLTADDFTDASPGIEDLDGAYKVAGTDTLTINNRKLEFDPVVRDTVTNLVTSYVPEGAYYVYFAATDGTYRTVAQVYNDPFDASPSATQLTVKHSPSLTVDVFSLNDFDGSGDGDLDVITGIDVSQMVADTDGKDLVMGPAQRAVTISWGEQGLQGDIDIDDNATIELYYSTRSDFKDSKASVAYTAGNSDGSDLLAAITDGDTDTHKIGETTEDPDGLLDNQYVWDIWSYVSPETSTGGTIPITGVRYYVFAILDDGETRRLVSLTRSGSYDVSGTSMALNFYHPPYIRPIEPARDINVTVDEPVVISWDAVDVDNAEAGGLSAVPTGTSGKVAPNSRTNSPNVRILLTSADFGEVTTWGSITNGAQTERFWVANSGDGSLGREIELNEGVDTAFVVVGNRLRNNLFNTTGLGGSSGTLELQTNSGAGESYYVYLAIDDGRDGTVADAVTTSPQQRNFGSRSPLVRASGTITFTGTVPASPSTATRFIAPARMETVMGEPIRYPIIPEVSPSGKRINTVDIFLSMNAEEFEAVDQDANTAGIQPFALGTHSQINTANVQQSATVLNGRLLLDFIYTDLTNGLTFFDGEEILATANLLTKTFADTSTVSTLITMDDSGTRVTKMLDNTNTNANAFVPVPTVVTLNRRSIVSGKVPLQGRTSSADTMTFILRDIGSFAPKSDSLFNLNDLDDTRIGVQVQTTDFDGKFSLRNVPPGRYVLTASIPRHLTGHDTILVRPGLDLVDQRPTRDGNGVRWESLLAGDAAGYYDSTGTSIPDNAITSDDINAVNDAIFTVSGDSLYNTFADINRDSIVNATDKDYATANQTDNTGAAGEIRPVFPTFKRALAEGDGSNAEALVTFDGLPDTAVPVGSTFDVGLKVSGARAVRTYELHVGYDPKRLAFEEIVSTGSLLKNYLTDLSGKLSDGEVGVVNSIIGRTPVGASGDGSLGTVRFRVVGRAEEARLSLLDAMLIDVDHVTAKPQLGTDATVALASVPVAYHDADGNIIRGLMLPDVDPKVDLNDFLVLVKAFGTELGGPAYDFRADLNGDDRVDFADFLIFVNDFGKVAADAPASGRIEKPATPAGVREGEAYRTSRAEPTAAPSRFQPVWAALMDLTQDL